MEEAKSKRREGWAETWKQEKTSKQNVWEIEELVVMVISEEEEK